MISRNLLTIAVLLLLCMEATSFLFWSRRRRRPPPPCSTRKCSWHWGPCSRSCGGGTQRAIKTVNQGPCGSCNMPSGLQSCNGHCCRVNCQWYSWGSWGACSKNCGTGTQTRSRGQRSASCGGSRCSGSSTETRSCNTRCCPVNCAWRGWSSWGSCSTKCGGGTSSRSRGISQAPSCGGLSCSGPSSERQQCNAQCCPVNCLMSSWTLWSECSNSCGAQGIRSRSRNIAQPSFCGGTSCSNILSEEEKCNRICFNGGKVAEDQCVCNDGWMGLCCEEDVNECNTVICPQNSKCMNILGSYECVCEHGYTKSGEICMDIDECRLDELHNCHEQASCINRDGHYVCQCNAGFSGNGTVCGDVDECTDYDYTNSGDSDYDDQETYTNESVGPLCHDDADCINTNGSYRCECIAGYHGDGENCHDIDECQAVANNGTSFKQTSYYDTPSCDQNAECMNIPGSYYCMCNEGYYGNGTSCEETDECAIEPCQNEGKCVDFIRGFKCDCSDGFQGEFCQIDIDECMPGDFLTAKSESENDSSGSNVTSTQTTCNDHSICTNTYGSFKCTCERGYIGNGFVCSDIDECDAMKDAEKNPDFTFEPCHANATCFNVIGNYDCKCNRGYKGSGFECAEIDECASTPCKHSATCIDELAGFSCVCPVGFQGLLCESDINECNDGTHDCHPKFGRCINSNGSHACLCMEGFSGDGKLCTDIDECTSETHDCNAIDNSKCRNSMGSYECQCEDGYERMNEGCHDVDECEIGNHNCTGLYQQCRNTKGSYICDCRAPAIKINGTCEDSFPEA